jgi:hypothetical protein
MGYGIFSDADIRGYPEWMVQEYVSNLYGRYGVSMEVIAEP